MRRALLLTVCLLAAGCGGHDAHDDGGQVWCVAPGEEVTPQLQRDYPELLMDAEACEAINR